MFPRTDQGDLSDLKKMILVKQARNQTSENERWGRDGLGARKFQREFNLVNLHGHLYKVLLYG